MLNLENRLDRYDLLSFPARRSEISGPSPQTFRQTGNGYCSMSKANLPGPTTSSLRARLRARLRSSSATALQARTHRMAMGHIYYPKLIQALFVATDRGRRTKRRPGVRSGSVECCRFYARWCKVILIGSERGHGVRCYIRSVNDGPLRPLGGEGTDLCRG